MPTYADLMFQTLTLIGTYGEPKIVGDDAKVVIYAQTGAAEDEGDFAPTYEGEFDATGVARILDIAQSLNIKLSYDDEHWDEFTDTTFTAFIIS